MLKFFLILTIIVYAFVKVGGFLYKMFFIGASESQKRTAQGRRKAHKSNLNIDYAPNEEKNKSKGYKGGDYVDYEEV